MRTVLAAFFSAAVMLLSTHDIHAQTADDAFGTWLHPDNGSHISVYKCGPALCAKIVYVKDPSRKDDKNADPKLRDRPVLGLMLMSGARRSGNNSWSGKLYNTQDGQIYNGTVTVLDKTHLKLEGCVMNGLICVGPTWTRVN